MAFYNSMAKVADKLLDEYGQTVLLVRSIGGGIDPVTGAITGTIQNLLTHGVLKPYPQELVNDSSILATDQMLTITANVRPEADDLARIGGIEHKVISIKTISPAGTPLAYVLQVRT